MVLVKEVKHVMMGIQIAMMDVVDLAQLKLDITALQQPQQLLQNVLKNAEMERTMVNMHVKMET